jgi:tRNA (Thr-GGU) A37 N-methylase
MDLKIIDARDNSPLIDIKCYIPSARGTTGVKIANWVVKKPPLDRLSDVTIKQKKSP